jgi:hypothetical protein
MPQRKIKIKIRKILWKMGDPQRYFSKKECPAISQKSNLSVEHIKKTFSTS